MPMNSAMLSILACGVRRSRIPKTIDTSPTTSGNHLDFLKDAYSIFHIGLLSLFSVNHVYTMSFLFSGT